MPPATFELSITLGNAEMEDFADIADALRTVASTLYSNPATSGAIRDVNGNTVGSWRIN